MSQRNSRSRTSTPSSRSYSSSPSRTAQKAPEKVVVVQHQQPGMAKTFGATAAGVAVGSAVGHTVGQAITGGAKSKEPVMQARNDDDEEDDEYVLDESVPCYTQIKEFLKCATSTTDFDACRKYNEALRRCTVAEAKKANKV